MKMEMTWQQWKLMQKQLRRKFSTIGWILLGYYAIMTGSVVLCMIAQSLLKVMHSLQTGDMQTLLHGMMGTDESSWGYFLAAAIGLLILLAWKKPRFWREEIWAKGKPMRCGTFFCILCVFMSGQGIYQLGVTALELILNGFGYSIVDGMNALAVDSSDFGMFLYAGILAPITEEILFRGLIQRTLQPYGKKFSIFCSAFCFGIFHGNLLQTPYAFLVGLVLGYVAAEYSIAWAMVLHTINNLVVADMLNRLTMGLSAELAGMLIWGVILVFCIAALVILLVKRRQVGAYLRAERMNRTCLRCFFSSAGIIVLMIVMGWSILSSAFFMIRPY